MVCTFSQTHRLNCTYNKRDGQKVVQKGYIVGDITKDFDYSEFECPCCQKNQTTIGFIQKLQIARSRAGISFVINSGYRCKKHNKEVGGVIDSAHLKGLAADIKTLLPIDRYNIVDALIRAGFLRIEICQTWTHCDIDGTKPHGIFLK